MTTTAVRRVTIQAARRCPCSPFCDLALSSWSSRHSSPGSSLVVQLANYGWISSTPSAKLAKHSSRVARPNFQLPLVQDCFTSLYHDRDFLYDSIKQPYLALSATNKQLRSEAVEIFFGKNTFMSSIHRPLGNVPAHHLRRMSRIDFLSSPSRFLLTICCKKAELTVFWYRENWTIPMGRGSIRAQAVRPPGLSWAGQRPWRVMKEFQSLIVQGRG